MQSKIGASKLSMFIVGMVCLSSCTHKAMNTVIVATGDSCHGNTPSFQKEIQPIFASTCAKSGCHNGVSMAQDFSRYADLKIPLQDGQIYNYVITDRRMPDDYPLDSTQYALIKCWLDNGYPDN